MSEDKIVETEGTETAVDTVPAPDPEAVLVDEECFLCVGLPAHPPEGSTLGLGDPEFHYSHGFADGVSAMVRGQGWHYCDRHRKALRRALLDRGVNWSPEPDLKKRSRIIG